MTGASDRGPGQKRFGLDLLLLAALVVVASVFWEVNVLRSGNVLVSLTNFDLFSEFFPRHSFASSALQRGELPLWDSRQLAGLPFLATFQGGVLYPPNLLYVFLPVGTAMGVLGLLHVVLAGAFMFLLCREFDLSRAASWLAGLTFMLGGSTLFMIYHTNAINSVPWLPAALYCTSRLGRSGNLRWALLLGLSLSLQFLAGRDYTFVMTVHAVWLFVIFQAVWMLRDGLGYRRLGLHLAQIALGAALAGGLVAVQAFPTLSLAADSGRSFSGLEGEFLEIFSPMPPSLFLANLINPVRGAIRREYFGWIPLVCFLLSFRFWGRDRTAVFASVISLLALCLCFGSQTPLYEAYRWIPLGGLFRLPDRFVFLFSLGLSLGAACGFDRLFTMRTGDRARLRRLIPRALLLLLFWLALTMALASGWLQSELVRVVRPWGWFSLYGISLEHFSGMSRAVGYLAATILLLTLGALRAGLKGGRLIMIAVLLLAAADLGFALENPFLHPARDASPALSGASCYEKVSAIAGEHGRHLSLRLRDSYAIKDKDGELFSTSSVTHYDPLVTRRQAAFFSVLQEGGAPMSESPWDEASLFMGFLTRIPSAERLKFLDLLGTRVILADGRPENRSPALSAFLSHFDPKDRCMVSTASGVAPVDLYVNPNALPRAFIVHALSYASSPEEALQRVAAPRFDPRQEAVVEHDVPPFPVSGKKDTADRARIVAYENTRVVVHVITDRPGLLVLTDTYDADWRATLNGESAAIFPANGLFRGVLVPSGESKIVFRYRSGAFLWGSVVSAIAAALWIFLWLRSRRAGD